LRSPSRNFAPLVNRAVTARSVSNTPELWAGGRRAWSASSSSRYAAATCGPDITPPSFADSHIRARRRPSVPPSIQITPRDRESGVVPCRSSSPSYYHDIASRSGPFQPPASSSPCKRDPSTTSPPCRSPTPGPWRRLPARTEGLVTAVGIEHLVEWADQEDRLRVPFARYGCDDYAGAARGAHSTHRTSNPKGASSARQPSADRVHAASSASAVGSPCSRAGRPSAIGLAVHIGGDRPCSLRRLEASWAGS